MEWPISGDACFYTYQLSRIGELRGQWWKLGHDEMVGAPYQPEFGKHPGVYEGVDLLMVSTLTSRWLDPVMNYHLMMMVVLVVNGWVVGWLVSPVDWLVGMGRTWRDPCELELLHGLPSSGTCPPVQIWLDGAGRDGVLSLSGPAHAAARDAAGAGDGPRSPGLILPWLVPGHGLRRLVAGLPGVRPPQSSPRSGNGRGHCELRAAEPGVDVSGLGGQSLQLLADSYGGHGRIDAWKNSAELWQYFLSPASGTAVSYVSEFRTRFHTDRSMLEGWHYPGWTVLLALGAYLVVRSRGRHLPVSDVRLLDRFVGISGLLVLLSLAGGPSFFLVSGIGCFRAYGRAGLLALALWCVAAPVALHGLFQSFHSGRRRRLAFLGLVSLSMFEGYQATFWFPSERRMEIPAWVDWLAAQPPDVRLAAFSPARERPVDWWGYESLFFKTRHRHTSLNGSDSLLFAADLKLLGATYEQMTPAGLRFVVSLGYDNLAFHREYLETNPWIRSSPWLDRIDTRGAWVFYRANQQIERLPRASLEDVMAYWPEQNNRIEVPADSWITGRFELPGDVVVGVSPPIWLVWTDERGRRIGDPARACLSARLRPRNSGLLRQDSRGRWRLPARVSRRPAPRGPFACVSRTR